MNIKANIPEPARILRVWEPFRKVIGVTVVALRGEPCGVPVIPTCPGGAAPQTCPDPGL
jgi:hypothetical protein